MEIWIPIKGYEETHEVSNTGKVRSVDRMIPQGVHERKLNGKELTQFKTNDGYSIISLSRDASCKTKIVHRLVAINFIPNSENKPHVNHLDGNKTNNHVSNLEWATISENAIHAFKNKLRVSPFGVDNGNSKMTDESIKEIRRLLNNGTTQVCVAKMFSISQSTVSSIKLKGTWSHLK